MESVYLEAANKAVCPGRHVRVLRTGQIARVRAVDPEWGRLFPHKGPLLILDVDCGRECYSSCEIELLWDEAAPSPKH